MSSNWQQQLLEELRLIRHEQAEINTKLGEIQAEQQQIRADVALAISRLNKIVQANKKKSWMWRSRWAAWWQELSGWNPGESGPSDSAAS